MKIDCFSKYNQQSQKIIYLREETANCMREQCSILSKGKELRTANENLQLKEPRWCKFSVISLVTAS